MAAKQLRKSLFAFTSLGLAILAIGYQGVQAQLSGLGFRRFAEAKASEVLKAQVKIGKIRYLPPARISLKDIQILESPNNPAYSILKVEKLVIGYGLLNFIRREFKIPDSIEMVSPQIIFTSNLSPASFLNSTLPSSKSVPGSFVINGGIFHGPWGGKQSELLLQKVRLKANPNVQGQIQLQFSSEIGGVGEGRIEVRGVTDPQFYHYDLDVKLKDVTFSPESQIPLKKISGQFHLSEKLIQIGGMTSFFHNWEIQWKGRIENWREKPKAFLDIKQKKGKSPYRVSVQMDFGNEKLSGEWSWLDHVYSFQGKVMREGKKIIFPSIEFPHSYTGNGKIDWSNGDYRFGLHRDRRRFQIHSNLNQLQFQTDFQLDHAMVNHLDWVVSGRILLASLPEEREEKGMRFKGSIQTDYFIVEFSPLQEFRGNFELDSEGVQAIDFNWGHVFHLGGRVLFKGGEPREDLVLRVDEFPLEAVKDFAGRPLPQNLRGGLEGKLKLRGEPGRPETQGYFTIKEGTIDKLNFDRAIIQFQGFPPYLRLYDSKIFRGRSTLKMLGAIDLNLRNIFHGIQIKGPDSLVIWKGVSAFWKEGQSAIQAEKPLGKKLTVGVELGTGAPNSQGEDREENHAVMGPKFKF